MSGGYLSGGKCPGVKCPDAVMIYIREDIPTKSLVFSTISNDIESIH